MKSFTMRPFNPPNFHQLGLSLGMHSAFGFAKLMAFLGSRIQSQPSFRGTEYLADLSTTYVHLVNQNEK